MGRFFLSTVILLLGLGISPAWSQPTPDYVPGEVLVKWAPGLPPVASARARAEVAGVPLRAFGGINWEHLAIDPTLDVLSAIQRLRRVPGVLAAEPNYVQHLLATPSDPGFGQQWGLRNTGQSANGTTGTPGADISASRAWDLRTSAGSVTVAIVDSGVTASHADLAGSLWTNPGEIAGNGVDDDANGRVDDVHGWNFGSNNADISDTEGHGTHVAGIIGARGNDASGIVGVGWSVRLMILKVDDASGVITTAALIAGIQYATAMRADLINLSLGNYSYSQAEKDAIDAFPGLVVAAAGNDSTDTDATPHYPSCFASANIIAVAATDQNDNLATFSNYGVACVDLAAPGVNILSDYLGGGFAWGSGTSQAAPHVAGVAALLTAQERNRTAAEVRSAILGNVDVKAQLAGKVATSGRLNAYLALTAIQPLPPTDLAATASSATEVRLAWTDASAGETGYEVQRKSGAAAFATVAASLAADTVTYTDSAAAEATTLTFRVRAFNSGAASSFSPEVTVTTPPAAPANLTAIRAAADSVALTWADRSAGETGYEIQRRTSESTYAAVATLPANATSFTDSGLTGGATYLYRMRATGAGGFSTFSNEATASLLAGNVTVQAAVPGASGGGGCFIATAAFGSPLAPEVVVLRHFRDRYLLSNAVGRLFVRGYYAISPPIADWLRGHEWARGGVRRALQVVVRFAEMVRS